jgi:PAS domain-containing protein
MVVAAVLTPASGAQPRLPTVAGLEATYDVYLSGIWAGNLTVGATFGAESYSASSELRTSGIVGFFYDLAFEAEVVGGIDTGGLAPEHYKSSSRTPKREEVVEISFIDGSPRSMRVEPARRVRPWSIDPGDQHGATDPLSAVLTAFTPGPADTICEQRVVVYDGKHLFALEIGPPQRDGARIRCNAMFVRLAGYKPKKMGKRAWRPFKLFLEERDDGLFEVVRAVGESKYGPMTLLLRE